MPVQTGIQMRQLAGLSRILPAIGLSQIEDHLLML